MRDSRIADLLVALAPRAERSANARALAEALGAQDFLLLVRDPELGVLVPAPGFPQTLRGGASWRAFMHGCTTPGVRRANVDLPEGTVRPAAAVVVEQVVAVLLGGSVPDDILAEVERFLPLVGALVRAELDALMARAAAADARQAASRAHALAGALELARADGAKLNAQLREEHRRKDEFLAMLSHELRNPLSPLVSSIDLLRQRTMDPDQVGRQLDVMARQARQLTRLVEDLLDVSRVRLGRIVLRRQPLTLREVLASALEASRPVIDARQHAIEVSITDEQLPLNADSVRLTQVFVNLLHNAAKYTDPGGRLKLVAEREGNDAVVRVTDNGIGVSPEFLPRMFDLFAQAPVPLGRGQGGLGIGLTLVRELVELHSGSVAAESDGLGRGSTFIVRLPLSNLAQAPKPPSAPTAAKARTPLRLLVVDDNADAADSLAAILRVMGHEVHVAYSGARALQVAPDLDVDLVLLDLGLPEMDGFEILRRLQRALRRPARFVALTGYGSEETKRRCAEAGFDEHIVKPVLLEQLEAVIQRAAKGDTRSTPAAA